MSTCPAGHESQASDYCDTCGLVIGGPPAASAASASGAAGGRAAGAAGGASSSSSGGLRAGGCPVCGAGRDGRFCEECGYDFELAEAMPATMMTPGVDPAEALASTAPGPVPTPAPLPARAPEAQASNPAVSTSAASPSFSAGGTSGQAKQGLDLEAELARAEAQAAPPAPAAQKMPVPVPAPVPQRTEPLPSTVPASSRSQLTLIVNADREYYDAQVERGDIVESEFPFPKYPAERRFTCPAGPGPVRIGRASSSRGLAPEIDLTGPPLDPAVSHLHAQLLKHDEGWVVVDLGSANGTRLNDAAEPLVAETEIPVKPGDRIHLGVWTTIVLQ